MHLEEELPPDLGPAAKREAHPWLLQRKVHHAHFGQHPILQRGMGHQEVEDEVVHVVPGRQPIGNGSRVPIGKELVEEALIPSVVAAHAGQRFADDTRPTHLLMRWTSASSTARVGGVARRKRSRPASMTYPPLRNFIARGSASGR